MMKRLLIFVLLGSFIIPAALRPSQSDDDDDEREAEYGEGENAEYIQEEKEAVKSENKRSYDDQAEENDEYSEPDSEDPGDKNNRQFIGDQKVTSRETLKEERNAEPVKEEYISHYEKSNMHKRMSHTKVHEPTPDVTLKDKMYENVRDQSRSEVNDKAESILKNKESSTQMKVGKVSVENTCDRNDRETDTSDSSAEKFSKRQSNKRNTIGTFDINDTVSKQNNRELSRKDLESLVNSLSIEKVNILKTLINDNQNVAKRDTARKPFVDDGVKSTDDGRINVQETLERCHSSIPSPSDSDMAHIHSLNTSPPSGCEIKAPNTYGICNLTSLSAEFSDTDTNQDKTHSKQINFMDDTLTDNIDINNEKSQETDVSDLEKIADLESFYDFAGNRNSYKNNENENTADISESEKFDSKLLKRDASKWKNADSLVEPLKDSFPKGSEKFNSDLEPLIRVKRTEGQKYKT